MKWSLFHFTIRRPEQFGGGDGVSGERRRPRPAGQDRGSQRQATGRADKREDFHRSLVP